MYNYKNTIFFLHLRHSSVHCLLNYYFLNYSVLVSLTLNYFLFSASGIPVINMLSFLSHMLSISLYFGSAF